MLIAFSGKKFAGKDTAAEILIKKHGFVRIGLADKLKDICSSVFQIPRVDMDDPSLKEKPFAQNLTLSSEALANLISTVHADGFEFELSEITEQVISKFSGTEITSIRDLLQTVGTDVFRNNVKDDLWLCYIKRELERHHNLVITDARFKNERDYLRDIGATLILVTRPNNESSSSHISENQIGDSSEYDVLVSNDASIHNLHASISMWYDLTRYEHLRNPSKQSR